MNRETELTLDKTVIVNAIKTLRSRLSGTLLQPGDEHYNEATKAWNLDVEQRPVLAIMAENVEDIKAAVQFARDANIGVGVMATGHGVGTPCNGGLLINTSRMRHVEIDPVTQTAKVEPGALWKDVILAAKVHGLAGLAGSAPHVGVVGYTLGGGFGYLGRKYGLNSASVVAADIVTADGKLLRAGADENAELFRGLKGSAGNLGIITSLEFRLYPLTSVYGGAVFYPIEKAREVLSLYAHWSADLPDEITPAFAFMNVPPLPFLPEPIRGRSVVVIKGCYCGDDPKLGEKMFSSVRKKLGETIMDTFRVMPVDEMDTISKDPVDPMVVLQHASLISDLSPEAIDALVKMAGADSRSPLLVVELRRLGGALQNDAENINLLGDGSARFSMNALGTSSTPEIKGKVKKYFSSLVDATRQFQTGETFINFMEVAPVPERVRSAYTSEDWNRLVALKTQYDPKNIFRFNRNIPPQLL